MPDLGWDATEELEVQEVSQIEHSVPIFTEVIIAIALVILTLLGKIRIYIKEILKLSRKAVKMVTQCP